MKKGLLVILACLTLQATAQKRQVEQGPNVGIGMLIGGASLTIAAAFTPTEFDRNGPGPGWRQTPLPQQSARFAGIVAGGSITVVGGLTAILTSDRKGKKRR